MVPRVDSTLSKGLLILETLAASPRPLGITELSVKLGLNKSNVHRLVRTLGIMDYVTQEPDRTYKAGLKLWKLGGMVMNNDSLGQRAARAMNDLARLSGETVHLSILDGLKTLYIEKVESEQSVRAYTERGGNAPLHCVATGKILLAYRYESLRDAIAGTLVAYTPKTLASLEALDSEMATIRAQGYAVNKGEYRADVGGLAAPIRDPHGKVIAAIGISGPLPRLTRQRTKELVPAVIDAGRIVSDALDIAGS